jgi:NADH-quinone oxidoreductase subunit C
VDAAAIVAALQAAVPGADYAVAAAADRPVIVAASDRLLETARALREAPALQFDVLTDVAAVDMWPGEPRIELIYHFLSLGRMQLLRLKVSLPRESPHVRTLSGIWPSANWLEREVWDLFGVVFEGHPDLRRLLMPEDWEGHPLRKDYPIQIRMKAQVYAPLQMTEQEFQAKIVADRRVRGGNADQKKS